MADETSAKVVYFVRHGQSEDNVAPVFQAPESPLSAVGHACKFWRYMALIFWCSMAP